MSTHVVQENERLSAIAAQYGIGVGSILDANPTKARTKLPSGHEVFAALAAGEELNLPGTLGLTIVTNQDMNDVLSGVNDRVNALDDQYNAAYKIGQIPLNVYVAWGPFQKAWAKYFSDHFTSLTFDTVKVVKTAEAWDAQRLAYGQVLLDNVAGKPTPPPTMPTPVDDEPLATAPPATPPATDLPPTDDTTQTPEEEASTTVRSLLFLGGTLAVIVVAGVVVKKYYFDPKAAKEAKEPSMKRLAVGTVGA